MVNSPNLRNRGPLGTVFSNRVRSVRLAGRLTRGFGKAVLLIGLCFVMIYPILFILSSGFKSIEDIYNPSVVWVPQQFSLQAMDVAIRILEYPKALLKTASILVPSVMLQLLTVLLAGYGFARFRFPGRSLFFGVLIFTIIVPVQSYISPLFVNMKNFDYFGIGSLIGLVTGEPVTSNLIDSPAVFYILALFGMGIRSGLCIFIIRQFFRNMPVELEEAAMIDGCGSFGTFLRVMIPNTLPLIATVLVFSIVWYYNDYYLSAIFFRADFPLSVSLTNMSKLLGTYSQGLQGMGGMTGQELGLMKEPVLACGCLLTLLPLILMYVLLQRYFTEGVERSGIVG